MAGGARGPLPKPDADRQRKAAPKFEPVELGSRPVASAPVLTTHARRKLHIETRAWWDTVVASPQASQFGAVDWQRLRMVVLPLVERYNRGVDPKKGVEPASDADARLMAQTIANLEAEFGLSPASRQRLRWTFRPPAPVAAEDEGKGAAGRHPRRKRTDPRFKVVEGGG